MIISEKVLNALAKDKQLENITSIYMNSKNINNISLKFSLIDNIEFLSLRDNNIKDLSFLKALPNIWYLDIRGNPIENFEMITYKNTFGFLGLSTDKYTEKNILQIKRINVGVLSLITTEDNIKKYFLNNNPNIIKFNDEIIYFCEKHNFNSNNSHKNTIDHTNSNNNNAKDNNIFSKATSQVFTNEHLPDNYYSSCLIGENEKISNLQSFFDGFSKEINEIINTPIKLVNNINSQVFIENPTYINYEKQKLIMLSTIYESFLTLNKSKNNIISLNSSNDKCRYTYSNMNVFIIDDVNDIFYQIIILNVLALYILQILGKDVAITIIKFILKNLINKKKVSSLDIQALLDLDIEYLVGKYYSIYNHFVTIYNKYINNSGTNSNDVQSINYLDKYKYEEIMKSLLMNNLILKCNVLKDHKRYTDEIFCKKIDFQMRKVKINCTLIKVIDEKLKMFDETFYLIQYLADFILQNGIDNILLKDHTLEYRIFIEIDGLFYNYLNRRTKTNLIYNTLTDRKYIAEKYKNLGNKLFFINNPVQSEKKEVKPDNVFSFLTQDQVKIKVKQRNKSMEEVKQRESYILMPKNKTNKDFFTKKFTKHPKLILSLNTIDVDKIKENDLDIDSILTSRKLTLKPNKEKMFNSSILSKGDHDNKKNPAYNGYNSPGGRSARSNSQEDITNKDEINDIKMFLDDKFLDSYVKLLIKHEKDNPNYVNKNTIQNDKSNYNIHTNTLIPSSFSMNKLKPLNSQYSKVSRYFPSITKSASGEKDIDSIVIDSKIDGPNIKHSPKRTTNHINNLKNESVIKNKTTYNFNSSIKKLIHHWNSNNTKANLLDNNEVKENEVYKTINQKRFVNSSTYTSADEIHSLFHLENKNEFIKTQYVMDVRDKKRKYTIKSQKNI